MNAAPVETSNLRETFLESGILVVDKPKGLTSMDVIRVLRRVVKADKIGHGGTLDPFATGVLPILFNRATRISNDIMAGKKEYEGVLYLGSAYDTQDMTGTPIFENRPLRPDLTVEEMQQVANSFIGKIKQLPPQYSAIKKNGRPLYSYARAGEEVEVEAREVSVEDFRLVDRLDERRVSFYVRCEKGVYVRTLVHDLGARLGCGAVVQELRRLQTGRFHIDEAVQLSTMRYGSDIRAHLKPITAALG